MNQIRSLLLLILFNTPAFAQDAKEMQETARTYMKAGDYSNAIIVLTRAYNLEPSNIALAKDLSLSYYFHNDFNKALGIIQPVLDQETADDQAFQIAGNLYKAMGMTKDVERIYKKGLKKFPGNGAMLNEMGEFLWTTRNPEAIEYWEKGIEKDPSYSKNYYNAARYYYLTTDKIWSILYGEIFVNMEPSGSKSTEIKDILLDSYKKFYLELAGKEKERNKFEIQFMQIMAKQTSVANAGINPETLTMIRTRFLLDWFNENKKPSFKLFEYQKQLVQEGLYEAYNQWLFGPSQNLSFFQSWINAHPDEYAAFIAFQRSRVFRMPADEYYH